VAYKYVQGLDYGPRKGTLGISIHMSEGFDGLPGYLAQHSGETRSEWAKRVSGVSCHVAILSTGEVVQMLGWDRACGNLNPADRAGEYGYYGGSYLRAVLGDHWPDPNAWTVSAELAGFRANGPTQAQVRATIKWGLEMRERFPTIRGATGHHDQSPKGCPGTTPAIKAIFEGLGGHGLFTGDDSMVKFTPGLDVAGTVTVKADTYVIPVQGGTRTPIKAGIARPALGIFTLDDLDDRPCYLMGVGADLAFIAVADVTFVANPAPAPEPAHVVTLTVDGQSVYSETLP
jgi:hypothetical protein